MIKTMIASLCFQLFVDFMQYIFAVCGRLNDRGCSVHTKMLPEDPFDDEPNTKEVVQEELETLYMGSFFDGEKVVSRIFSSYTIFVMYSGALPMMYLVGFVTFFVCFWLYKYLLVTFYAKTDQALEPELVSDIFGYMKFILFVKLALGFFVHCNTELFDTNSKT
jgi:hypothetical protein